MNHTSAETGSTTELGDVPCPAEVELSLVPVAKRTNSALGWLAEPERSPHWLATSPSCPCSAIRGDFLCGIDGGVPGRTCQRVPFDPRISAFPQLVLCSDATSADLAVATAELARTIFRRIELEKVEQSLLEELSMSWESLEAVYDISANLFLASDHHTLLEKIFRRACVLADGIKAALWLDRDGKLEPVFAHGAPGLVPREPHSGLLGRALAARRPLVLNGKEAIAAHGDNLEHEFTSASAVLLAPINSKSTAIGVLVVWQTSASQPFDTRAQHLVQTLAQQAGMVVENNQLYRSALANERLHRDLEIGAKIQQTLLFGHPPRRFGPLEIAALSIPSSHVDGDFFDYHEPGPQILDLVQGDVMGKGIAAALLGAAARAAFPRAINKLVGLLGSGIPGAAAIVEIVNGELAPQLIELEKYVTLAYARLDPSRRSFELVDCGHTRTLRYQHSSGTCEWLSGENFPLGFSVDERYTSLSTPLEPGDVFLIYTDGVTDVRNPAGEPFGEERLLQLFGGLVNEKTEAIAAQIRNAASTFGDGKGFPDDLTFVVVKVADEY